MKTTWLLLFVALLPAVEAASALRANPHIVIILVDDMGYGDPGCYNPESKIPTPNIDSAGARGHAVHRRARAGPLCHPSRYGLLTGRYPFRTDVSLWPKQPMIEEGQMTIASLLQVAAATARRWSASGTWVSGERLRPAAAGRAGRSRVRQLLRHPRLDRHPALLLHPRRSRQSRRRPLRSRPTAARAGRPSRVRFWRAGGIAPDLKLKDVLPRFTDEAVAVIRNHASESRRPTADALLAPTGARTRPGCPRRISAAAARPACTAISPRWSTR